MLVLQAKASAPSVMGPVRVCLSLSHRNPRQRRVVSGSGFRGQGGQGFRGQDRLHGQARLTCSEAGYDRAVQPLKGIELIWQASSPAWPGTLS